MRPFRRALLIAAGVVLAIFTALVVTFLAAYLPASSKVSAVLSEVPAEGPPPDAFFEAAICVHHHGVSHLAARKLLTREGLTRTRALTWAVRYFVWNQAVDQRSPDDVMALFANHIRHPAGSGLISGARAYFSKSPEQLTRAEALELVLADAYPTPPPSDRLEFLRRSCS